MKISKILGVNSLLAPIGMYLLTALWVVGGDQSSNSESGSGVSDEDAVQGTRKTRSQNRHGDDDEDEKVGQMAYLDKFLRV